MGYYIAQDGHSSGPFGRKDLLSKWLHCEIKPDTLIWHEGMPEWSPLNHVVDLPCIPSLPPKSKKNISHPRVLASRAERLGAILLDLFYLSLACVPVILYMGWESWQSGWLIREDSPIWSNSLSLLLLCITLFVLLQVMLLSYNAQTLGKKTLGISIILHKSGKRAKFLNAFALRYLPISLFMLVPVIGHLYIILNYAFIFRNDRRCLHDHIAQTSVVRVTV